MNTVQIIGIALFGCGFLNSVFALILWIKGKTTATFHLGWVAFFSAVTAVTFGGVFFFEDKLFWARATWLTALLPPSYIVFLYHFGKRVKNIKLKSFFWYLLGTIFSILALTTPYVLKSVSLDYPFDTTVEQGFLRPIGRIYGIIAALVALYYIFKEYSRSEGFRKEQIKYFILGLVIYDVAAILITGLMPLFFPKFIGTGFSAFASIFWIGLTTYAIFTKKLFEMRLVLTEILVTLIGVILLLQVFLAETFDAKVFEFLLFILFSLIGYLLIKTTYQDIKRKEEAERLSSELRQLSKNLEEKVKERTKELEKSYKELQEETKEAEKRKEELEKFQGLTVGRELEMVDLKKRIKELEQEIERLK